MNQSILLSIKPKYVEAIKSGKKRFEFRKKIWRSTDVEKIYIYASSPIKKIVGYFTLGKIIKGDPLEIWKICSTSAGISKKDFFEYYEGKTEAYALSISELNIFDDAVCPYVIFDKFTPPQSFMYFDELEYRLK